MLINVLIQLRLRFKTLHARSSSASQLKVPCSICTIVTFCFTYYRDARWYDGYNAMVRLHDGMLMTFRCNMAFRRGLSLVPSYHCGFIIVISWFYHGTDGWNAMARWWKHAGSMVKQRWHKAETTRVRWWNNDAATMIIWWYDCEITIARWYDGETALVRWWTGMIRWWKRDTFITSHFYQSYHRNIEISPSCYRVIIIVSSCFHHRVIVLSHFTTVASCIAV